MNHHVTYTLPRMLETVGLATFCVAMLAIIIMLSMWTRIQDRAADDARAAYEAGCVKAGCTHAHSLTFEPEPPPAGSPSDCPFHCSPECDDGEWHCAEYHLPASQRDHDPRTCTGNAMAAVLARRPATATLPAVRDRSGGWDIEAEKQRVIAWADKLAAG